MQRSVDETLHERPAPAEFAVGQVEASPVRNRVAVRAAPRLRVEAAARNAAGVELSFDAELWLYSDDGGWHFVTLPADVAEEVREAAPMRRGFGSVRVTATVGDVRWATSLFPDSKSASYVLPMKKQVRDANDLLAGDTVRVRLEVL